MITAKSDLDFLANNVNVKKDAFIRMANDILNNYNNLTGANLVFVAVGEFSAFKNYPQPICRLIDKLEAMTFDIGSPISIPSFLNRIITKGIKMQFNPSGENVLGLGHFRWDWSAYTLDNNELKAIAMYLNISVPDPIAPITNKERYEFSLLDYEQRAEYFLKITNTKILIEFKEKSIYFDSDKEARDIYVITLQNKYNRFRFTFGQSIKNEGTMPTAYDVLSVLNKYDIGTYENFCDEFGYSTDSRKARAIYKATLREFKNLQRLFPNKNELELLQEIQ